MTKTGTTIAALAATLFAQSVPLMARAADGGKVHCQGVNQCKGHGACKGAKNACSGQNGCKGQGWMEMTEKECKDQGGKVAKK